MPRAPRRCSGDNGNCINLIRNARHCPDHTVAWKGPRTASSRATSTWEWQQLRTEILERDGYQCQIAYEGICTGYATTVDKNRPAAQRPDLAYDRENLQAACDPCNEHKARTIDQGRGNGRSRRRR
jgi:5-methylcytosine-specific restriction endonuclease McrA